MSKTPYVIYFESNRAYVSIFSRDTKEAVHTETGRGGWETSVATRHLVSCSRYRIPLVIRLVSYRACEAFSLVDEPQTENTQQQVEEGRGRDGAAHRLATSGCDETIMGHSFGG